MFDDIAVIGSGAWGTALALAASHSGRRVKLWSRDADQAEAMIRSRENSKRLPGIRLPESIQPTSSLKDALANARAVILAVPAQHRTSKRQVDIAGWIHGTGLRLAAGFRTVVER